MKHHNNLTDDQIHLPKGFQPASNRSVLIKNSSGGLVWDKANYTSSIVVSCVADSGGDLHHRYFCLFSSDDANKYAVYFDVTSVASFSTPDGYTGVIQVDCTATGSDSTAIEVAGYLQTAINSHADFSSTDDSAGTITVTGVTTATDAVDSSTGFIINTTQTKINNEVLTTDSSGNITWGKQKSYHHNSFRYSANNLDGTSHTGGSHNAWTLAEPNNNAHNRFFTMIDLDDMDYQKAGKGCVEMAITGVTSKLVGGTIMCSGEPSDAHSVTIWKGDFDAGSGTGMPMTLMGTFSIAGSGNTDPEIVDISLELAANCTLADGDGVVVVMEGIESYNDHDVRGTVTLRFEDTI